MPVRPKIINKFGTLTGWNNITVNIFGRDLEGIDSVKYNDEEDIGVAHGSGKMPIGKTRGNYTATASMGLYFEESTGIITQMPAGSRLQDIPDFDVTVAYEFKGKTYKDIIRNCSFKNNGREVKNGEGKIVTEYTLVPSHIDYNV